MHYRGACHPSIGQSSTSSSSVSAGLHSDGGTRTCTGSADATDTSVVVEVVEREAPPSAAGTSQRRRLHRC